MRWLKPSFDPIVLVISSSGSRVTPHLRSYIAAAASRSLGRPRLSE